MSGLTSKTEKVVDITDYLPEDISLTDENAGSVVVTVGIDKDGTKSYDISMGAIKVNNLANGLSLSYESADVLEIQIRGPGDILDQYKISDNVSIDLKNYQTAGTYTVPVTVGVPDGCVLESTVSCKCYIGREIRSRAMVSQKVKITNPQDCILRPAGIFSICKQI